MRKSGFVVAILIMVGWLGLPLAWAEGSLAVVMDNSGWEEIGMVRDNPGGGHVGKVKFAGVEAARAEFSEVELTQLQLAQVGSERVEWTVQNDGRYELIWGNLSWEIDAHRGARITAFRLEGANILSEAAVDSQNYGSTVWTSPQSDWGWPPVPEIDGEPYTSFWDGDTLVMLSGPSATLGVQMMKRFSVDPLGQGMEVEYRLQNLGSERVNYALWEVSRLGPEGLTFFPRGERPLDSGEFGVLPVQVLNGVVWVPPVQETLTTDSKLFADGAEGWLAHVSGDRLLLKTWSKVPLDQQAPGEGEIEIFARGDGAYIEAEQQGPYRAIAPGEESSWTVRWSLRRVPKDRAIGVGSESLIAFVRQVLKDEAGNQL